MNCENANYHGLEDVFHRTDTIFMNGNMSATSVNPVAAYNWVGDMNGDGKINALDLNIVTFQKGRRANYTRKVT